MGRIQVLPKIIQNQIAAGEVVERPASIVKELIENSLDAHATDIRVEVVFGGMESIVISDNGSGMDEEDALLSLKRHATSKIQTTEDLFSIHSYGFRGEALASISAVSHFTLSTKTAEQLHGIEIRAIEEEILSSTAKGLPKGTTIKVEELFFNTPARKKYLKSAQTEYGYILRLVHELALSHPHVSFTLVHNNKITFAARSGTQEERIREVLGKRFIEESIPLFLDSPYCKISGRVSKPFAAKSTRREQYILVNNRPIQSDIISKAVSEAFHRILAPGLYPAFVIQLEVPSTEVDVNVHPRKKEVKFVEPQRVFGDVKRTVADSLSKHEVAPIIEVSKLSQSFSASAYNPLSKAVSPYASNFKQRSGDTRPLFSHQSFSALPSSPIGHFIKEAPPAEYKGNTSLYNVIGQIHNCYIAVEGPEGFVLIDQHAAHERVLFDTLCRNAKDADIAIQHLLSPEVFELTSLEHSKLIEHLEEFSSAGFTLEDIGDGSIALSAIPSSLHQSTENLSSIVRNMLHEFEGLEGECNQSHSLRTFHEKVLAYTACRSAVKFGDHLSMDEMRHIIDELSTTERPDTCPHGRTSRVIITLDALKKLFDR